ncbi:MAG: hypothetical protein JWM16_4154, partial [Verrucomicrobiales bacterium]|nr:hypothetical protein [Verrucomicrobiales bacterium]
MRHGQAGKLEEEPDHQNRPARQQDCRRLPEWLDWPGTGCLVAARECVGFHSLYYCLHAKAKRQHGEFALPRLSTPHPFLLSGNQSRQNEGVKVPAIISRFQSGRGSSLTGYRAPHQQ